MIKYSNEEGFIKPKGIKFREGQDKNIILPKVAVGVFSRHLFQDVIQKFHCTEVGYISTATIERNIYILNYKDTELTFFMAGVSGPWISAAIEEYIEESETIDTNPKYIDDFLEILAKYDFDYTKGYTWTTDAFYRETKEKIDYFKNKGAICVEMEGSVIASVCKRLNIDYFTFYYAGDNLDSTEWDERSLSGLANINKKKEVMLLALELALKINN